MTIETLKTIASDGAQLLGALSILCTALSHVPLPKTWTRVSEFFARVGLATSRYSVNKRTETP